MWWVVQRVHRSWLVALVCGGFVIGVAVSLILRINLFISMAGFVGLIVCISIARAYTLPFVTLASVIVGLGFGTAHLVSRDSYAFFINKSVQIKGRIKEDISLSASGASSIQLDNVELDNEVMPGSVYASFRGKTEAKRGDFLYGYGEVSEGFGSFPASLSLIKITQIRRTIPGDVGRVMRDWFADAVRRVIPEPQASLGIGSLTGQKSALPPDLADALKIAGLTHIVVASGYNLTILVRMARKLFAKVSKYMSALSASIMIAAFVAITGLSPSMTRAGLVSSMSLLSWYYGHVFRPFILLPVAAAITVAFQPSYVWGDLGWQLSFSAFAGVMILAPLLQAYFYGAKEPGIFRQILGETIAAHIVTIPIIALSFGTVSNVAIIANILVVPLVPLAMLLTFICGIGSILAVPFLFIIATPTTWLLQYMTTVASFVSELSWAQSEINTPPTLWIVYGVVLAAISYWMWRASRYNFRKGSVST
ncbi:MAG: ComEC/Rec2 family competence protein [Candidatus Microsaccharimonas sp.]